MIEDLEKLTKEVQALYDRFGTVQSRTYQGEGWREILNAKGEVIGKVRYTSMELRITPPGDDRDPAFADGKEGYADGLDQNFNRYAPNPYTSEQMDLWEAGWAEAKQEAEVLSNE